MSGGSHGAAWASAQIGSNRLVRAGAEWISQRSWHAFATLTFARPVSQLSAWRALDAWLRWLSRSYGGHVGFAWGGEPGDQARRHFHCLLCLPREPLDGEVLALSSSWGVNGSALIDRYDPARDGAAYALRHNAWDVGVTCPRSAPDCRRRRGCREAKRFWK
jgi:hypothetical protein